MPKKKKKLKDQIELKKYRTELIFKLIAAIGVISAIVFGAAPFVMKSENKQQEYYYKAELLQTPSTLDAADEFKLIQFEINGLESGYEKSTEGFAGISGKEYTTYSLDTYYSQSTKTASSNPVFNVTIQNNSDRQTIITDVLYRIHKTGQVRGGDYGPLSPNVKYRHGIDWKKGDQLAKLSPPFSINEKKAGSFLLEIESIKKGAGLTWLLEIAFIDSNGKSVKTSLFQLIMSKNNE